MDDREFIKPVCEFTGLKFYKDKSIDELFHIDGVPLSWIYDRLISKIIVQKFKHKRASRFAFSKLYGVARKIITIREFIRRKYRKEPQQGEIDTLFLTYSNHVWENKIYRISNIMKEMEKRGKKPMALVTLPFLTGTLKISSTHPVLYDYITPNIIFNAHQKAKKINRRWKKVFAWHPDKGSSLGKEINFFMSTDMLFQIFLYYKTFKNILQTHNVKQVILTANIGIFDKTLMLAAREMGVPLTILQHGGKVIFGNTKTEYFPLLTYAVFGERYKTLLQEHFNVKNPIIVTGSPETDNLVAVKKTEKKRSNTICFISQPFFEIGYWSKQQFSAFCKNIQLIRDEFPEKDFVVKLHPRENKDKYTNYLSNITIVTGDLHHIIHNAEWVIGVYSTALEEALCLDVPVIVFDMFKESEDFDPVADDICLYLTNTKNAKSRIINFLKSYKSDSELRKRINQYIASNHNALDGKSSSRVADVILRNTN